MGSCAALKVNFSILVISPVTGPKFNKFVHDIVRSLALNNLPIDITTFLVFQNASVPNEGWLTFWSQIGSVAVSPGGSEITSV